MAGLWEAVQQQDRLPIARSGNERVEGKARSGGNRLLLEGCHA